MTDEQILEGVRAVAREHLDYQGEVTPELELVQAMALDSVRMLTLVVEVENHFDVCLEEGDEQNVVTVADLVALLRTRLEQAAEADGA